MDRTGRTQLAGSPDEMPSDDGARQVAFGYAQDEVRSAIQKAIRRGQEEQAAWWAWCLIKSGQVRYLWSTLALIASEDVGLGDTSAALAIDALARNAERASDGFTKKAFLGIVEMHAICVLCRASKDWQSTHLLLKQQKLESQVQRGAPVPPIPKEAIDAHTRRGRRLRVPRSRWYAEGDALYPRSKWHHVDGGDPHADIHGDEEVV